MSQVMIPIYECMKGTCLGFGVGALATMVLYTTGVLEKIKNRKSKQMKIVSIFCFGIVSINMYYCIFDINNCLM